MESTTINKYDYTKTTNIKVNENLYRKFIIREVITINDFEKTNKKYYECLETIDIGGGDTDYTFNNKLIRSKAKIKALLDNLANINSFKEFNIIACNMSKHL